MVVTHLIIIAIKIMKKLQYLKTASLISFLIITYSGGTLVLNMFFWLIVGILASLIDFLCLDCDHIEPLKNLFILILVFISFYLLYNKRKYLVILSIIIQYLYLIFLFKINFIKYWYFTIPTIIYTVLSLILLYFVIFKKNYEKK